MFEFPETGWELAAQLVAVAFSAAGLGVIAGMTLFEEPNEKARKNERWTHFLEGFTLWLLFGGMVLALLGALVVATAKWLSGAVG